MWYKILGFSPTENEAMKTIKYALQQYLSTEIEMLIGMKIHHTVKKKFFKIQSLQNIKFCTRHNPAIWYVYVVYK